MTPPPSPTPSPHNTPDNTSLSLKAIDHILTGFNSISDKVPWCQTFLNPLLGKPFPNKKVSTPFTSTLTQSSMPYTLHTPTTNQFWESLKPYISEQQCRWASMNQREATIRINYSDYCHHPQFGPGGRDPFDEYQLSVFRYHLLFHLDAFESALHHDHSMATTYVTFKTYHPICLEALCPAPAPLPPPPQPPPAPAKKEPPLLLHRPGLRKLTLPPLDPKPNPPTP